MSTGWLLLGLVLLTTACSAQEAIPIRFVNTTGMKERQVNQVFSRALLGELIGDVEARDKIMSHWNFDWNETHVIVPKPNEFCMYSPRLVVFASHSNPCLHTFVDSVVSGEKLTLWGVLDRCCHKLSLTQVDPSWKMVFAQVLVTLRQFIDSVVNTMYNSMSCGSLFLFQSLRYVDFYAIDFLIHYAYWILGTVIIIRTVVNLAKAIVRIK